MAADTLRYTPPGADQFRIAQNQTNHVDTTMSNGAECPFALFDDKYRVVAQMHYRVASDIMRGYIVGDRSQEEAEQAVRAYLAKDPRIPVPSYDEIKKRIEEERNNTGETGLFIVSNGKVSKPEEIRAGEEKTEPGKSNTSAVSIDGDRQEGWYGSSFIMKADVLFIQPKPKKERPSVTNAWTNSKHSVEPTRHHKGTHKGTGRYSGKR